MKNAEPSESLFTTSWPVADLTHHPNPSAWVSGEFVWNSIF